MNFNVHSKKIGGKAGIGIAIVLALLIASFLLFSERRSEDVRFTVTSAIKESNFDSQEIGEVVDWNIGTDTGEEYSMSSRSRFFPPLQIGEQYQCQYSHIRFLGIDWNEGLGNCKNQSP